jgi:hypothetical protein
MIYATTKCIKYNLTTQRFGSEVVTAMNMKSVLFWVVMTCTSEITQCFRGEHCFHLQVKSKLNEKPAGTR